VAQRGHRGEQQDHAAKKAKREVQCLRHCPNPCRQAHSLGNTESKCACVKKTRRTPYPRRLRAARSTLKLPCRDAAIDSADCFTYQSTSATILPIRFHERPPHVATAKRPPLADSAPMPDTLPPRHPMRCTRKLLKGQTGLFGRFDLPTQDCYGQRPLPVAPAKSARVGVARGPCCGGLCASLFLKDTA